MARRRKGGQKDNLGKVMGKVGRGSSLSRTDRLILSGAIDGAKKARSERRRKRKRVKRCR